MLLFVAIAAAATSATPKGTSAELAAELATGSDLRSAGRHDEAQALYARLTRNFPDRVEPSFFSGLTHRAAGRTDEALTAYRRSLAIQPTLAEGHMNVASLIGAHEDGRDEEALYHYKRALALRTWPPQTAANAEYNAALALRALGRGAHALAAARRARKLQPDFDAAEELVDALVAADGESSSKAASASGEDDVEDADAAETTHQHELDESREERRGQGACRADEGLSAALRRAQCALIRQARDPPALAPDSTNDAEEVKRLLAEVISEASGLLRRLI